MTKGWKLCWFRKEKALKTIKTKLFRAHPIKDKIIGVRITWGWMTLFFPAVCFFALIWVLIRVIPKPSRAAYPCQQVAMPLASTFLLWLAGITGSAIAFRRARHRFHQARFVASGVSVAIGLIGAGWAVFSLQQPSFADYPPHAVNAPIGIAKGLQPGRVVWAHNPDVTDWLGPGTGQRWYDHVHQAVADDLMSRALRAYAGKANDATAWDAIFRHHNGGDSYQPGEEIMIKVNLTTSYAGSGTANIDENYNWNPTGSLSFDSVGHSPQLKHALLDQLVNVVGVNPSDITIGDPTGLWINELYVPLHDDFPNVHYLDNFGEQGRARAYFSNVLLHWSPYWRPKELSRITLYRPL